MENKKCDLMLWVNISLGGRINENGGDECHNNKMQLNANRVYETLLFQYWDMQPMTNTRANKHTDTHMHAHVHDTTLITCVTTSHKSGGHKKSCNFLRFIWNSTAARRCQTINRCFSVPSQILGLHRHVRQKPCVCSSRIPAKLIYWVNGAHMSSGIVHRWLQSCLCVTGWTLSAATSMMRNKMSWVRWSTDEARVKLNTYSCKSGSLCKLGRWPRGGRYSLRPRAHGSRWKAKPTGDERNRVRWAKTRQEETESYKTSARSR